MLDAAVLVLRVEPAAPDELDDARLSSEIECCPRNGGLGSNGPGACGSGGDTGVGEPTSASSSGSGLTPPRNDGATEMLPSQRDRQSRRAPLLGQLFGLAETLAAALDEQMALRRQMVRCGPHRTLMASLRLKDLSHHPQGKG